MHEPAFHDANQTDTYHSGLQLNSTILEPFDGQNSRKLIQGPADGAALIDRDLNDGGLKLKK